MIEVIKTNPFNIPVGTQFVQDEYGRYGSYEIHEECGDDFEFSRSSLFGFSPSFYESNKEIFTEVKIEETNEKNEMGSGPESQETESKSEDVCSEGEAVYGAPLRSASVYRKELQREEMEEGCEESEIKRQCISKKRFAELQEEYSEDREENNRIARFAEIDDLLFSIIGQIHTLQEGVVWTLRDELQQLRKDLR